MNDQPVWQWKDIRVERQGDQLVIENAAFSRTFLLRGGLPSTQSFTCKATGFEYAAARDDGDCNVAGFNMPWRKDRKTDFRLISCRAKRRKATAIEAAHARIELRIHDAFQELDIVREYIMYPEYPMLTARTRVRSAIHPLLYWTPREDLDGNKGIAEFPGKPDAVREHCIDGLRFRPALETGHAVEFFGRTDYEDLVVEDHDWDAQQGVVKVKGNLLYCPFGDQGLIVIQHAPPSSERRDPEPYDFRIEENTLYSCGSGIAPYEVAGRGYKASYEHTICLYRGGAQEAERTLKRCTRARYIERPDTDYQIVVNPWGGGRFFSKISPEFLEAEVRATGDLGGDCYQIDDGWEQGGTLADLTVHNRPITMDFWRISGEKLGGSFDRQARAAAEAGTELALWIAPSFNRDYTDWKDLVSVIWDFHKTYGMRCFKLDGIMMRTKLAEDNLERLLRALRLRSGGDIIFNMDTTNGQRPGYWHLLQYGAIFLENRYVDKNWGVGYDPENVLKSFWRLARYVRPQKLQIEIPDPGIINREFYRDRSKPMPDRYPPAYWAAIAWCANPLAWFNPSTLSDETRDTYRRLLRLHRRHREAMFAGEIYPVGDEPNGAAVTGFQSHCADTDSGYLAIFREHGAPAEARIGLRFAGSASWRFEDLEREGESITLEAGHDELAMRMDSPCSYRLYRYRPA